MPGLRDKLINDAIEILLYEHVVVPMEDNVHAMINKQLMNRLAPAGPMTDRKSTRLNSSHR